MAKRLQFALASSWNVGNTILSTRAASCLGVGGTEFGFGICCGYFRVNPVMTDNSMRMISSHLRSAHFARQFSTAPSLLNASWMKRRYQKPQTQMQNSELSTLFGTSMGSMINCYTHTQPFTTSSIYYANRHNKDSIESTSLGASKYSKRKRSSIMGQISNSANSFDFLSNKRTGLKSKISKGVRSIRSTFFIQNKKLRDNIRLQKAKKNGLVRNIKQLTKTKKEDIKTIPNLLTTLRMASAPVLSYLVISDCYGWALSIFVLAGLSDMLDGYIARNFKNQKTAFGTALDPLADKFLISFLTVSLTANGLIPVPLTVLILGRDAGLVIASFYIRYISLAPPRTLARYFDFSHVTAKVYPSNISKINTAFQLSYVACTLAAPVFDFVDSPWLQLLMYTTAATTFLSGADYMLTWRRRLKIIKNT